MNPVKVSTFLKLHRRENWKIKMNDIKKEVRSKRKESTSMLIIHSEQLAP